MVLAVILGAFVAYPVVMRILAILVQPNRLEMARLAFLLKHDERLNPTDRAVVTLMASDAFDPKVLIVLVFMFPRFAVLRSKGHPSTEVREVDPSIKSQFDSFMSLHTRSLAAANPLFFAILLVELMLFGAISAPLEIILSGKAKKSALETTNLAVARSGVALRAFWLGRPA